MQMRRKPRPRDAVLWRPVLTLGMPLKEKGPGTVAGRRGAGIPGRDSVVVLPA
jgi:hypothetical protein